jgi:hypothetical protein
MSIQSKQLAHDRAQDQIEHMWAEDGVIHVIDKKGTRHMYTVKEAAQKAVLINQQLEAIDKIQRNPALASQSLKNQLDRGNAFVTKVIELCKIAKRQQQSSNKQDKTSLLNNFLEGKDPNGNKIKITDEDKLIELYKSEFFTLDYSDIRDVLRSKSLAEEHKKPFLSRMHTQKVAEANNFKPTLIV